MSRAEVFKLRTALEAAQRFADMQDIAMRNHTEQLSTLTHDLAAAQREIQQWRETTDDLYRRHGIELEQAHARIEALEGVAEAASGFWDHFEHGQPGVPGTTYPMTYEQLDAWHDEYDRWLAILGSAVTALDAAGRATL